MPPNKIEALARLTFAETVVDEAVGFQLVVSEELVQRPMKLVGARFNRGVEDASGAPTEFGVVGIDLDLHLLNGVRRGNEGDLADCVHVRDAVEENVVAVGTAAAHGHVGNRAVVEWTGEQASVGGYHSRSDPRHQVNGAAIHRQIHDTGLVDHLTD